MPWKCGACFSIGNDDKVKNGHWGIAWCANSSGNSIGDPYTYYGVVQANSNNQTFKIANTSDQGWDDTYSY